MHKLILVRHGESEHHIRDLTGGWTDTPLTERGKQQAERIGHALTVSDQDRCSGLFSSDLLRARQTAEIISKFVGTRPVFRAELRELNNGVAKDKSLADARSLELPMTKPTVEWEPYPGAESWKAMSLRITRFMSDIAARSSGETVLIVSHGDAMVAVIHWWLALGEEYWSKISFELECGSITRLTENRWGEKVISKLNDTSHLIAADAT
jgi:probable phosphoglycerate mutase